MNAKNIGQRIKERRNDIDLTQEQLAKDLGFNKSTIQRYETGQVKSIKIPVLQSIAKSLNVNPEWLACKTDIKTEYLHMRSNDATNFSKYGIKPIKTKKFRMLGEIACGQPIFANEDYETFIEASADINADFCLTAKGDSMINARIFDGDIVFIKEQSDVENGDIAAIIIGDTATLKRVYKYTDRLELRPENPTHSVQNYEGEELNQIKILGKAVAFQSYVR